MMPDSSLYAGIMTLRSTRTHGGHGWLFHNALCVWMASGAVAGGRQGGVRASGWGALRTSTSGGEARGGRGDRGSVLIELVSLGLAASAWRCCRRAASAARIVVGWLVGVRGESLSSCRGRKTDGDTGKAWGSIDRGWNGGNSTEKK